MRIRNGFKETFFATLSNDGIVMVMDLRVQVLKWMSKMKFFGLKKKKPGGTPPTRIAKTTYFRTEKRFFRYPPLVPVMLFIRRSKTVL